MNESLVVMGVSGCGKSTLAEAVARSHAAVLVEGDSWRVVRERETLEDLVRGES